MKDTDDEKEPSGNERMIRAFASQFNPPLRYVRTDRINNIKFPDAWVCSYWDDDKAIGITATVYEGQLHAFIEAAGQGEQVAKDAGLVISRAMELLYGRQS
jgi:hypothetical protein